MAKRRLNIKKIEEKVASGCSLYRYEESYLWAWLRDKADSLMSIFVKYRDKDKHGLIKCISCPKEVFRKD
jgi:hypothetical protein